MMPRTSNISSMFLDHPGLSCFKLADQRDILTRRCSDSPMRPEESRRKLAPFRRDVSNTLPSSRSQRPWGRIRRLRREGRFSWGLSGASQYGNRTYGSGWSGSGDLSSNYLRVATGATKYLRATRYPATKQKETKEALIRPDLERPSGLTADRRALFREVRARPTSAHPGRDP